MIDKKILKRIDARKEHIDKNNKQIQKLKIQYEQVMQELDQALDTNSVNAVVELQKKIPTLNDEVQALELINSRLENATIFTLEEFTEIWEKRRIELQKQYDAARDKMRTMQQTYKKELAALEQVRVDCVVEHMDWTEVLSKCNLNEQVNNLMLNSVALEATNNFAVYHREV